MKTLKKIRMAIVALSCLLIANSANSFCGFYVAKADASLFNESSKIIMVRDGNKTVITMSNDYQGALTEFAMVIPVPEVLKKEHIRIAKQLIFDKLDAYSTPRIAEYYDNNPCYDYNKLYPSSVATGNAVRKNRSVADEEKAESPKVVIEAEYTIGEYDILILSSKESDALESWLIENGYKIPNKAKEVLEPYVKNNMKFFVVKVNLEEQKKTGFNTLRPIQIAFNSDKFMLPIRLGMANSKGNQDMIVYAFTKNGRVETANYRTVKLPTDKNIPLFVQNDFGKFYKDLYAKTWNKESGKAVILEYAWDLSSTNFVKCDPCATTPPTYAELREAGVYWAAQNTSNNRWGGADYTGDVFFTRLHVRYNRDNYPQDLLFTNTPNKESFQGRYVLNHPAGTNLDCDQAQAYYKGVVTRRQQELKELAALTGWDISKYNYYLDEYAKLVKKPKNPDGWIGEDDFSITPIGTDNNNNNNGGGNNIIDELPSSINVTAPETDFDYTEPSNNKNWMLIICLAFVGIFVGVYLASSINKKFAKES